MNISVRQSIASVYAFCSVCRAKVVSLKKPLTKREVKQPTFLELAIPEIRRRKGLSSDKTITNELTAVNSFIAFAGPDILLDDITTDIICRYEHWLKKNDKRLSTSAAYMRSLRSLLNRLGADGKTLFGKVRTAKTKTTKRAIRAEELQKIATFDTGNDERLTRARDLFIFSFLAMGMPFIDLFNLKRNDYKNGFITYERTKTQETITVKVSPQMKAIIDKYQDDNSPFLFPMLEPSVAKERGEQYKNALAKYNRALAEFSKRCHLLTKVTSYTASHFAFSF